MKHKILLILFSVMFVFSNVFVSKAVEPVTITDNYRIYELFNLSDTKNINFVGNSIIDISSGNVSENSINGLYKGEYILSNSNSGNSTLRMGLAFNSSIENLKYFSLKVDEANVNYSLKFLNDKFKFPTGTKFYKEIVDNISIPSYEPQNFKKEDVGILRKFNIETDSVENLKYEIIVKYSSDTSKVILTGGADINLQDSENNLNNKQEQASVNKNEKILKLTHDLSGKHKMPILFAIGDNVNITTKVYSGDKEIATGYKENIDKSSISVIDYFKEMFLSDIPENIRQKFSEENLFEIYSESFDKILGGNGYDNLGILNSKNDKQIALVFEFPIESKKEKKISIVYPITVGLTTVNSANIMKLNLELSALSTFDKFEKMDYTFIGNENYKYIASSNVKYKNAKDNSTISINKVPTEIVENLIYKEKVLEGISEKEPKSYTNYILPLLGFIEVVSIIYIKNVYFKKKTISRRNNREIIR